RVAIPSRCERVARRTAHQHQPRRRRATPRPVPTQPRQPAFWRRARNLLAPIRIGVLMDYVPADSEGFDDGYESYPDIFDPFRMVAAEYRELGRPDRAVRVCVQ